ncbi:MAG TPA: dephospho-CoA kinase [Acidisarcina sp.]|nr:dephospho-CoA kinase [Acidisarcina sp.]
MLRVGLTGGLGSGKSTVAQMFRALGAHVIEADAVGRELMQPGQAVYEAVAEHFGRGILKADGTIDRRKLSMLAFEGGRIEELNRLVHPAVIAAQEEWANRLFARQPNAVAMVESALIFEAERSGTAPGWRDRFDRVILVSAPDDVKIARYVERISPGHWNESVAADARARLAQQIPDSEKAPRCDYVIENTGTLEDLGSRVREIYRELSALAQRNPSVC